jgi:hypothetical protein
MAFVVPFPLERVSLTTGSSIRHYNNVIPKGVVRLEESGFHLRTLSNPESTAGQIPRVAELPSG